MIELGIVFLIITALCVKSTIECSVLSWEGLKDITLSFVITFILFATPFVLDPKIKQYREPYLSTELHQSITQHDVSTSEPVIIYEFKIDRPFTWLGDGKMYKLLIPPVNDGRRG